ncbi:MAG: hypothetical protein NTU76_02015, partial [Candidatus Taylorbacteria bacterium]|nr:hypothetical protein [Candidatus Taylorbacteria bacterium]
CKKTWRTRQKKRGRKKIRVTTNIVADVLLRGETLSQRSRRGRLSKRQCLLRYHRALDNAQTKELFPKIPKGKLILIVDGLWTMSDRKRYVIYLMALRPIDKSQAFLVPPTILSGSEIRRKWETAIESIPPIIKRRIIALVCDGISGLPNIAKNKNWIVQRCNFHFIKVMERFRGKKNSHIKDKELREDIYQTIRSAMIVPYGKNYDNILQHLEMLITDSNCPKWVRFHGNEFMEHREAFRAYLRYPEYNLPFTTSSMENLCSSVRDLLRRFRGFKSEKSLSKWIKEFVKLKEKITCNGKNQPN